MRRSENLNMTVRFSALSASRALPFLPSSHALLLLCAVALLAPGCTAFKRWAYASGDRDEWQQPARVVGMLGIESGDRVADLGSGGGYFTFRLAEAVGADGLVYAVDVDEAMNDALAEDVRERSYANVKIVLGGYDDPRLEPGSVDFIFTSNTYHHIENRVEYFRNAARALAADGRIAIVEYKPEGWFYKRHGTSADDIRSEMLESGYRLISEHDFLEKQHFLVFGAPAG
jgi:ubiquinone/menaquinone biosynthesis C-methylase UbiE